MRLGKYEGVCEKSILTKVLDIVPRLVYSNCDERFIIGAGGRVYLTAGLRKECL